MAGVLGLVVGVSDAHNGLEIAAEYHWYDGKHIVKQVFTTCTYIKVGDTVSVYIDTSSWKQVRSVRC